MDTENASKDISFSLKRERSASYPALTVMEAYEFASTINEKFSLTAEVTREEISHVFGVHSNTLARDIASCVQYGFLSRTPGENKYKLTSLFIDIFRPESEKDKKLGLLTAFSKPRLYQDLITKFDNQVIPIELPNTLIKYHDITEGASKSAADVFIKSATEVGAMNESRTLKFSLEYSTAVKKGIQYAEITDVPANENNPQYNVPATITKNKNDEDETDEDAFKGLKRVPIYLTKHKTAFLLYPETITANDIAIIKHQLEGILLRIQLENEENK